MTMILVLGGTVVCAITLLYFSLLPGRPPVTDKKRASAEAAAAVAAAAGDRDR